MTGLSRFDFYPRDWHLDTRDLSAAAKGIYIDLLSGIYARGGPLPYKERELCQLCGCATARSLRPLLDELIRKGKLKVIDGHIWNGRAMEEITKAEHRQAIAREGGKAKAEHQKTLREAYNQHLAEDVQPEFGSNSVRTRLETRSDIEENQQGNSCSPSPSPSIGSVVDKSTTGAPARLFWRRRSVCTTWGARSSGNHPSPEPLCRRYRCCLPHAGSGFREVRPDAVVVLAQPHAKFGVELLTRFAPAAGSQTPIPTPRTRDNARLTQRLECTPDRTVVVNDRRHVFALPAFD